MFVIDVICCFVGTCASQSAGNFWLDIQIADSCVPSCVNADCGNDGCGGSCGECSDGKV